MQNDPRARHAEIASALGVQPEIDVEAECERRIAFLVDHLQRSGLQSLVLGISGGIDSTLAGRLCQLAVEHCRASGLEVQFYAMRLPYGEQRDAADAQRAIEFIRPDQTLTVDIKPAADQLLAELEASGLTFASAGQRDFVLGNIKARQRMVAQYAVAGARAGLVVGTDQAAEAVMGFFTKFGDGACDLIPLAGLTKRQVRALAGHLGAPRDLVEKVPTADLESLQPLKPDEEAYGLSYDQIDDFLEGKPVSPTVATEIVRTYDRSAHKRAMPPGP
ncbi:MAG: ammonia-dependent NAD(+) synthetase [Spongiibacteraceae bacterium]|nr:ammonia-dependent NAD(+) synthetase [Spongiibacteraceae bacterium]